MTVSYCETEFKQHSEANVLQGNTVIRVQNKEQGTYTNMPQG